MWCRQFTSVRYMLLMVCGLTTTLSSADEFCDAERQINQLGIYTELNFKLINPLRASDRIEKKVIGTIMQDATGHESCQNRRYRDFFQEFSAEFVFLSGDFEIPGNIIDQNGAPVYWLRGSFDNGDWIGRGIYAQFPQTPPFYLHFPSEGVEALLDEGELNLNHSFASHPWLVWFTNEILRTVRVHRKIGSLTSDNGIKYNVFLDSFFTGIMIPEEEDEG